MAWIELHQTITHHKKTYALAELLGVRRAEAIGHCVSLWLWALDAAEDGDLTNFPPRAIADAALWTKKPERLLEAMVNADLLERRGERLILHDWDDYAGRLVSKRRADRDRKRTIRAVSNGQPADSPEDGARNRTVPNPTKDTSESFRRVVALYEGMGWTVNPGTLSTLNDLEAQPIEWVEEAFKIAAKAQARDVRFVEKIMDHWDAHGRECECKKVSYGTNGSRGRDGGSDQGAAGAVGSRGKPRSLWPE